jgi:cathepsin L
MKFLIHFAILLVSVGLSLANNQDWPTFKTIHKKQYTIEEDAQRRAYWQQNVNEINAHNERAKAGQETYTKGVNEYSDLSFEEFSHIYLNARSQRNLTNVPGAKGRTTSAVKTTVNIPASLDLRNTGYVGAIKNQGSCGSCYAFSVVASLEGAYYYKYKRSIILSEQNIIDCSRVTSGCNGGNTAYAFSFIISNGGIDTASSYPLVSSSVAQSCKFNKATVGTTMSYYNYDASSYGSSAGNELFMQQLVALYGPISVMLYASSNFQNYKSGVFKDNICNMGSINHAVTVVGYGTDSVAGAYWIIRNQWGTGWGESGYMRMARNRGNMCYVSSFMLFPTV